MNDNPPSMAEIAALTARLRALSNAGAAADPAERARFLADKDRLMDRIGAASSRAEPRPPLRGRDNRQAATAADTALDDAVRDRAEAGGYALVGPSARTWRADPDTGQLLEPVSEAEHRTLRHLLGNETVTTTEPAWADTPDGQDIVSAVIPLADEQVFDPAAGAGPWTDYRTYSPADAVDELVARGVPPTEAPGLLGRYLNEMTAPLDRSAAEWDIDEDDLAVIAGAETLDRSREYSPSPDVQVETWLQASRDAVAEARNSGGGTVDATLIDDLTAAAAAGLVELESRYDDLSEMVLERDESRTAYAGLSGAEGRQLDAGPALTAEEAAHELAADGRPLDEARAVVRGYLDDTSERVGTSVHLWGLDEADLAAMRADPIERARTAAAVLDVASEAPPAASTKVEQVDEDGWSR